MFVRNLARCGLCALAGLILGGEPALSQENPLAPEEIFDEGDAEITRESPVLGADGQIIEEILITSQSRDTHDEQSISEPTFIADDLMAMRIHDLADLARQVRP